MLLRTFSFFFSLLFRPQIGRRHQHQKIANLPEVVWMTQSRACVCVCMVLLATPKKVSQGKVVSSLWFCDLNVEERRRRPCLTGTYLHGLTIEVILRAAILISSKHLKKYYEFVCTSKNQEMT